MEQLPTHCLLCAHRHTGEPLPLRDDPWHWLVCSDLANGELRRRHDTVADAIGRVAWQVGAQVQREVEGLNPNTNQRPDVQIVFPGRILLTDVAVSHTLIANHIARYESSILKMQGIKDKKYAGVGSRLGAELMNFSIESNGGMGGDAACRGSIPWVSRSAAATSQVTGNG